MSNNDAAMRARKGATSPPKKGTSPPQSPNQVILQNAYNNVQ